MNRLRCAAPCHIRVVLAARAAFDAAAAVLPVPPPASCISARQPFRLAPSPCALHELCESFQHSPPPPSSAAVAAPHEEQRHRVRALSKRDAVPFTCLLHLLHSTCSPLHPLPLHNQLET